MENYGSLLHFLPFVLILLVSSICVAADEDRKVHIVYMGPVTEREYSPSSDHYNMLQEVTGISLVEKFYVRSFKRSFNGFAANLTDLEAQKLLGMPDVVSVFPSTNLQLQTTRSWDFMGFNDTDDRNHTAESDITIGVIDTGIWPESASFSDEGFGPPPKKWKGTCKGGQNFTCNNKIIGARFYASDSARDDDGHGTHTSSTAAGDEVRDANFFQLAEGTARGGVPSARIATYKVCNPSGCASDAVLAAFDDAIADGVDIITISLGQSSPAGLLNDTISIGSFHAMEKGILTSHSAGNSGPSILSVASLAPWLITVAASSTDRKIIDKVILGDGKTLMGNSVNSFIQNGTKFPLVYGNSNHCVEAAVQACTFECLDSSLAKGKIVVCDSADATEELFRVGAFGSIYQSSEIDDVSFVVPLPALSLARDDHEAVKSYVNSTKNPVASILKSNTVKDLAAPLVASFSSRGPNFIVPDILKPDVSAPGVDILAAYSPIASPTDSNEDTRRVKFNILSGTSMACPHVAAVAAYIKSFHPHWSPSAIKSAIMTTATPMNATTNPDGEFAYGSGHINPVIAVYPGLVYEASKADYVQLLCSLGYDAKLIRSISGDNSSCSSGAKKTSPKDLNYPSMTANVTAGKPFEVGFRRTLTNVGHGNSTYKAKVITGSKLKIKVVPETLFFKSLNEKVSFDLTVCGGNLSNSGFLSASLEWSDGAHSVRSPIVIHTIIVS